MSSKRSNPLSLDIYLNSPVEEAHSCECSTCNNVHETKYFPCYFHVNITHNLTKMADACSLYKCIWRAPENNIKVASQLIPLLESGLGLLFANPEKFKSYNPENGWGTYEFFVDALNKLLSACKEHPTALIEVCR